MPFLIYRQDTHGGRYLDEYGLEDAAAQARVRDLTSGQEHHQDYFIVEYQMDALTQILKARDIRR